MYAYIYIHVCMYGVAGKESVLGVRGLRWVEHARHLALGVRVSA